MNQCINISGKWKGKTNSEDIVITQDTRCFISISNVSGKRYRWSDGLKIVKNKNGFQLVCKDKSTKRTSLCGILDKVLATIIIDKNNGTAVKINFINGSFNGRIYTPGDRCSKVRGKLDGRWYYDGNKNPDFFEIKQGPNCELIYTDMNRKTQPNWSKGIKISQVGDTSGKITKNNVRLIPSPSDYKFGFRYGKWGIDKDTGDEIFTWYGTKQAEDKSNKSQTRVYRKLDFPDTKKPCCDPGFIYDHLKKKCIWQYGGGENNQTCAATCAFSDINDTNNSCKKWENIGDLDKAKELIKYFAGCEGNTRCEFHQDSLKFCQPKNSKRGFIKYDGNELAQDNLIKQQCRNHKQKTSCINDNKCDWTDCKEYIPETSASAKLKTRPSRNPNEKWLFGLNERGNPRNCGNYNIPK
jgi:hypothetical protein